jgi:hypothetical protein
MEATKEKHATHTPGPWGIQDAGPGTIRGLRFRVITDEKVIAKTSDGLEEARANARLIAAAPELLEQCKLFEKVLTYYYGTDRNTAISAIANENRDKLREVLAKVEGGEG